MCQIPKISQKIFNTEEIDWLPLSEGRSFEIHGGGAALVVSVAFSVDRVKRR